MELAFRSIAEDRPGEKLRTEFRRLWPHLRRWYLSHGEGPRPTYLACERALRSHAPEFLPIWRELAEAVGEGEDLKTRLLSQYRPPPYVTGCSQAVWTRDGVRLVRNYDYHPRLFEGLILRTRWGTRQVIATSDCIAGALDGMNEDGLAVSLAFGGRRVVGDGFSAPFLLRLVLETCTRVSEAEAVLRRVPVHMAYNLLVADAAGDFVTARVSPGNLPRFSGAPASTNHQETVILPRHARITATLGRETRLFKLLETTTLEVDGFERAFLEPPLHNTRYSLGFGTLYTVVLDPVAGEVRYRWQGRTEKFTFRAFPESSWRIGINEGTRGD